ncbi:predicted protein [Nematostella vectensis]|uniref:Apple domain-containing protein n=1 Tax=Nematostella vectensis TaxID=45351 RepID=A7SK56_NEMVE|nr:predicted protein [Nematostella vectensis]|eukprot:XP_001627962.1 predicted protein [Nematostella vectensis]
MPSLRFNSSAPSNIVNVTSLENCVFECVGTEGCKAANVGKMKNAENKFPCELFTTISLYNQPSLVNDENFDVIKFAMFLKNGREDAGEGEAFKYLGDLVKFLKKGREDAGEGEAFKYLGDLVKFLKNGREDAGEGEAFKYLGDLVKSSRKFLKKGREDAGEGEAFKYLGDLVKSLKNGREDAGEGEAFKYLGDLVKSLKNGREDAGEGEAFKYLGDLVKSLKNGREDAGEGEAFKYLGDLVKSLKNGREDAGEGEAFKYLGDLVKSLKNGWTMVFKVESGASAPGAANLWVESQVQRENDTEVLTVIKTTSEHYKNRIVNNWETFDPKEVLMVVYKNGVPDLQLRFNAKGSDRVNWYEKTRLLSSPWTDLMSGSASVIEFNLVGWCNPVHPRRCRMFYTMSQTGGCPTDTGWLMVTEKGCSEYETDKPYNTILYSMKVSLKVSFAAGRSTVFISPYMLPIVLVSCAEGRIPGNSW